MAGLSKKKRSGKSRMRDEDKERLKEVIKETGYEPWEVKLGVEGVRREV